MKEEPLWKRPRRRGVRPEGVGRGLVSEGLCAPRAGHGSVGLWGNEVGGTHSAGPRRHPGRGRQRSGDGVVKGGRGREPSLSGL